MDVCRICLTEAVERDITQLTEELKGDQKSCWDIMVFCLNIQVSPESKLTTKLCIECFSKIISYHDFKMLALKSDTYLHRVQNHEDGKCGKFEVANIKCEDMNNDESYEDEKVCEIEPICKIELVENRSKTDNKLSQNEPSKNNELSYDENEDNRTTDDEGNTESEDVVLSIIKKIKDQYEGETGKEKKKSAVKIEAETKMVKVRRKKKPETCEECGKTVFRLFEHMKLHKPEGERKRFKCEVCDKTFASYGARHTHNKIKHLGIKQHCDECGKDVVDLRNHRLVMHSADELPFACAQCGQRFITASKLQQHTVKHSDHRPHVCDVCDKDFQHHISLLQHKRRIHDQERTHLCQVCSRSFFSKYHLKLHIRSHTKEKPVECPECGKGFISTVTMRSHQLIHSETKDFACSFCDMAFKKPGYLRNHMKIHTKEKPYSCSFCDMAFARSDHRARHQRAAHAQPYAADDT